MDLSKKAQPSRLFRTGTSPLDANSSIPNNMNQHDKLDEADEFAKIQKIKKQADKAFKKQRFENAYDLYKQALEMDPNNYEIIACLIGTALNLGHLDEVFEKAEFLIKLNPKRAQGYYLKGMAHEVLFQFEQTIELFIKALEFEQEHRNTILKNLTKTIAKYLSIDEPFQLFESSDNEETNLLNLIDVTDKLIKKKKFKMVTSILSFIQSLDTNSYNVKTEMLMCLGRLLKSEEKYDKALLSFEECLYLANLNDDHKLKINSIIFISSCYLQTNDLHRVIVYYHKLIDVESDLLQKVRLGQALAEKAQPLDADAMTEEAFNQMLSLDLRIAIRQNLFTAHYRLGKLRVCCYYLDECIRIIDESLKFNDLKDRDGIMLDLYESFDFIQIKFDACIELCKLYQGLKEFGKLQEFLKETLEFIETLIDISQIDSAALSEKQVSSMKQFRLRCYSYLGVALAGLREFRFGQLCIRKSLCLVDRELKEAAASASETVSATHTPSLKTHSSNENETESLSDQTSVTDHSSTKIYDIRSLNFMKVECLLQAAETYKQCITTFREMKFYNDGILTDNLDNDDRQELEDVVGFYEKRVEYARNAYTLSKMLIDPSLRTQTTFQLALALYECELYQSAAYYFQEVLSISVTLLKTNATTNAFTPGADSSSAYTDATPDHHLESSVYLIMCYLMLDHYQIEPITRMTMTSDAASKEASKLDGEMAKNEKAKTGQEPAAVKAHSLESLYKTALKNQETVFELIRKWKYEETNRTSFLYSEKHIEVRNIKGEAESERLRSICDLCAQALAYISFRLEKFNDCLLHMERSDYLLNVDGKTLPDKNRSYANDPFVEISRLNSFDDFVFVASKIGNLVVKYKFVLNAKLLLILVYKSGQVVHHSQVKVNQIFEADSWISDKHLGKLADSQIDYILRRFEMFQNEWIKKNLTEIESRELIGSDNELRRARDVNKQKERNLRCYLKSMHKNNESRIKSDFRMSSIDLSSIKIYSSFDSSDPLDARSSLAASALTPRTKTSTMNLTNINYEATKTLQKMFLEPILPKLASFQDAASPNFVIDSKYAKLLVYALNSHNYDADNISKAAQIAYVLVIDSFSLFASSFLKSMIKYANSQGQLEKKREQFNSYPKRALSMTNNNNQTDKMYKKVSKSSITPHLTSNPRLARQVLNESPDSDYVLLKNDHEQRIKSRLDSAVGVLISNTITGTTIKHSYLEVLDFKQIIKPEKCCVMGCPDVVPAYSTYKCKLVKFLTEGFDQLREIAEVLYTQPIFGKKFTKQEALRQLESNTVIFLSTYSSNDSNAFVLCSESAEYPNCPNELEKYCHLGESDLDLIDMSACNLIVLNCYSVLHSRPRFSLAKKLLMRGCKCVLMVLSPLPTEILTKFYTRFFNKLKGLTSQSIGEAYKDAMASVSSDYKSNGLILSKILRSSVCLIGSANLKLSLKQITTSMVQANINSSLSAIKQETNIDHFNMDESKFLATNYFRFELTAPTSASLEKTLTELQILFKFFLHQLVSDSGKKSLDKSETKVALFYLLYDLISKAITYIKTKKVEAERLHDLLDRNQFALNLLNCLGFQVQRSTVVAHRDLADKKFITFPESRFLDLNLRAMHIMSSLIEICFEKFYVSLARLSSVYLSLNKSQDHEDTKSTSEDILEESKSSKSPKTKHASSSKSVTVLEEEDEPVDEMVELRIKLIIANLQSLLPIEDKSLLTCIIDILALTQISADIVLCLTDYSVAYAFNFYERQNHVNSKEYAHLMDKDLDKWYFKCEQLDDKKAKIINLSNSTAEKSIRISKCNKVANFLFSIGFEVIGQWLRFTDIDINRKIIDLMLKFLTSFSLDRDMSLYRDLNIDVLGQHSATIRSRLSFLRSSTNTTIERATKEGPEILFTNPWCTMPETNEEMQNKISFIKKFIDLSKSISQQRTNALRHHLNYAMRQHAINKLTGANDIPSPSNRPSKEILKTENSNAEANGETEKVEKVKFKAGGNPSKDRVIVNEKYKLSLEQINQIRQYSHFLCHKNLDKIDTDFHEKSKNLILPYINNAKKLNKFA